MVVRSVTRMSHASGNVALGKLPGTEHQAEFKYDGFVLDPMEGLVISAPVGYKHNQQQEKIKKVREIFEDSPV